MTGVQTCALPIWSLENQKWLSANKKCMAFTKNTIENAIAGQEVAETVVSGWAARAGEGCRGHG